MEVSNPQTTAQMCAEIENVLNQLGVDPAVSASVIKKLQQPTADLLPSLYSELAAMGTKAIDFLQYIYQYFPHIVMENSWIDAQRQLEIVTVRDYNKLFDSITFAKERAAGDDDWFILEDQLAV